MGARKIWPFSTSATKSRKSTFSRDQAEFWPRKLCEVLYVLFVQKLRKGEIFLAPKDNITRVMQYTKVHIPHT